MLDNLNFLLAVLMGFVPLDYPFIKSPGA